MNSFFNALAPYFSRDYLELGLAISTILILLIWNVHLEVKFRRFSAGKNAQSLESTIMQLRDEHKSFQKFRADVEAYLESAEMRIRRSVQGVHTVRFNPFKGVGAGGNQSFATAFINEEGDGVVISTLYARDRMSFYSKSVSHFTSSHELTDEERDAIAQAQKSLKE